MTYNIALVSDFFLPNLGGVEVHILNLAKSLIKRGNKVIVITHSQHRDSKIKFVEGVKVYYLPISILIGNCSWPSFFSNFFQLKKVFNQENIQIIHGHQSMSPLAYEALLLGQLFNLKTVFTDHSLFVSNNLENIIVNRLSKFVLGNVNRIICVSYELKDNLLERIEINHEKIHVIPNGVSNEFKYYKKEKGKFIKVVICCRLVYRKGVDLLLKAIPLICKSNKKIQIILVGDGPKKDEIDQMVDDTNCNIKLIKNLSQKKLNTLFNKCDIFLNTSLTESFCIANLEAACCGLKVVCTNVGGVKEVLPPSMIKLVKPHYKSIAEGVKKMIKEKRISKKHAKKIKKNYSWKKISKDTELIYKNISDESVMFNQLFYNTGEEERWLFRMILLIMLIFKYFWIKCFEKRVKKINELKYV
ncbi:GPI-anchor biosynthesis [Tubulinosema ratisbonensis]|uniref:GPI-anchor biosynthesis n=1 Tax=Tubulinosema ratisbonensis TaxID=291195 RepID=A0A437AQ40_9MICR|nr:GPI-anchor biosynthesis [Tubulinosema ratisbonensis]